MQIDVSPPVQVEQGFQKDVLVLEYLIFQVYVFLLKREPALVIQACSCIMQCYEVPKPFTDTVHSCLAKGK